MHLVIDIGNSMVKSALFEGSDLRVKNAFPQLDQQSLDNLLMNTKVDAAMVCTVRKENREIQLLTKYDFPVFTLDPSTTIPIKNLYQSPETLGMDRLAAVTGAAGFFPKRNLLVVCAGTCLTFDFLSSTNEYQGGSIAPGMEMRLNALNHYTGKLPRETPGEENIPLTGTNTREAILSGVINGMAAETDGIIAQYRQQYHDLAVVLSGGDVFFFDKKLKNRIFAIENIVLHGLNKILEYNVQKTL